MPDSPDTFGAQSAIASPPVVELEASLLGGLLSGHVSQSVMSEVIQILQTADAFADSRHRRIFASILRCDSRAVSIDTVSVTEDIGVTVTRSDAQYIQSLAARAIGSHPLRRMAESIVEHFLQRQLIDMAVRLRNGALVGATTRELLEDADMSLSTIAEQLRLLSGPYALERIARRMHTFESPLERRLESSAQEDLFVSTPFAGLDELIGGLRRREVIVLASLPGGGKTALALHLATHIASAVSESVLYCIPAQPAIHLSARIIAQHTGVDVTRILRGVTGQEERTRIREQLEWVRSLPLYFDDNPYISIHRLRVNARSIRATVKLGAIFVDTIQSIVAATPGPSIGASISEEMDRPQSPDVDVRRWAYDLRRLARDLDVPIICLSQLKRRRNALRNLSPELSDLTYGEGLEEIADLILLLHRPVGPSGAESRTDEYLLHIAKHRDGPLGQMRFRFDPSCTRFAEVRQGDDES